MANKRQDRQTTDERRSARERTAGRPQRARADAPRRIARAETDDFADAPRQRGSGRGAFVSEHSDAVPGGVTAEHSGQVISKDGEDQRARKSNRPARR